MYVLALKNEYLVIDGTPYEDAFFPETSEVVPLGQFVIDTFNEKRKEFLNTGGTIDVLKKTNDAFSKGHTFTIPEGYPAPPILLNPTAEAAFLPLSEDFTDIVDKHSLTVSYRAYRGNITPVFQVDKLSDLYMYDLAQVRMSKRKIVRLCENCGKAFSGVGKSNACYCEDCKYCIEENKRKNRNDIQYKVIFDRIRDRRTRKNSNEDQATYYGYYNNLVILRDRAEEAERENIERGNYSGITERMTTLDLWDRQFFNLCKFYRKEDNNEVMVDFLDQFDIDRAEWNIHKSEFPLNTDDPAQWLNEWINRRNSLTSKEDKMNKV